MAFKSVKKSGGDYPAKWDKLSQKVIEGTVIEYKTDIMGKPGSDAIVLENEDGQFTVWLDKVLKDFVDAYKVGNVIRITYLGKQKSKKGFEFNNYEVGIDDGSGEDEDVLPFDKK